MQQFTKSYEGGVETGGKGGFGIKMPKFGKRSSSSSSSEDDGHGNRVKKVKGPKVEAKVSGGGNIETPKVGVRTGIKGGSFFFFF